MGVGGAGNLGPANTNLQTPTFARQEIAGGEARRRRCWRRSEAVADEAVALGANVVYALIQLQFHDITASRNARSETRV